jgi:hypothetical protein
MGTKDRLKRGYKERGKRRGTEYKKMNRLKK